MKIRRTFRAQTGMSLVEIMVALTLSLILVAGVGQIYVSSRQTYRMQDAQARLQENARFALELLAHDIRLAGYLGCSNSAATTPTPAANAPAVIPSATVAVISGGNDNTGAFNDPDPALANPLSTGVVSGTDAMTVLFGEYCGGTTTANVSTVNPSGAIAAANTCGITLGTTPLAIADCSATHIFTADGAATPLGYTYAPGSEIMLYRSYTYYIRQNPSGQPALYRYDNIGADDELVEGVENMQITYGIDTDGDGSANRYLTADNIADWRQVVSIRFVLTFRTTEDNLTSSPRTYTFDGAQVTDHRLSRTYTSTIALRNRLP